MQPEKKRMNITQKLIEKYNLQKHPEGGFFRETYRSTMELSSPVNREHRNAITDIYFLLSQGAVSRFHKVIHDEIWHFYEGAPLTLIIFDGENIVERCIGPDSKDGYKAVVPGGLWQSAVSTGEYSLVGCTVAPGFDFTDFSFLADDARLAEDIETNFLDYAYLI